MVNETMIWVSDITQYFYCPRKVYFMKVLGISVPAKHKMELGKEEHKREHRRSMERKDVYGFDKKDVHEIYHRLAIEAPEYRLYGILDTVLILNDGEIIPVEIKYSKFSYKQRNWVKQLVAYALLLESKFNKKVKRGVLYFPNDMKQIILDISPEDKLSLIKDIERVIEIISKEIMPTTSKGKKCAYCEMSKFCKA